MDKQRELLDQLMGKERNVVESEKKNVKRKFTDRDVDKYYLCGCSPHELFNNTKSDLGPNPFVPDDRLKEEWEKLTQEEKDSYGFEYDTMIFLQKVVDQCERRIERNKKRAEDDAKMAPENEQKLKDLEENMRKMTEEAISIADTEPDRSEMLNSKIEKLKANKERIMQMESNKKTLVVCDVSGNLLSSADTEDRLQAHLQGKQYTGWKLVRDKLKELKEKNPPPRWASRRHERGFDNGRRSNYRSRRRSSSRERYSDRGRYSSSRRRRSRSGGRSRRQDGYRYR